MAKNYGGEEQSAPVQKKYEYKICRRAWNRKTQKYDGCGRLFTADSVIDCCPDCGAPLAHIRYGSPATERVSRIHMEKCEKCANSVNALKCFCGPPPKAEWCQACRCRACCRQAQENSRRGLLELTREVIRKRIEDREKAEEAERKAQAESGAVFVETEKKPRPGFKTVGRILEDELLFGRGGGKC